MSASISSGSLPSKGTESLRLTNIVQLIVWWCIHTELVFCRCLLTPEAAKQALPTDLSRPGVERDAIISNVEMVPYLINLTILHR